MLPPPMNVRLPLSTPPTPATDVKATEVATRAMAPRASLPWEITTFFSVELGIVIWVLVNLVSIAENAFFVKDEHATVHTLPVPDEQGGSAVLLSLSGKLQRFMLHCEETYGIHTQ